MAEQNSNSNKTKKVPALRVTTKRDGFRRGGRDWHGTSEVPLSDLSKAQIAQLKSEPMLLVEEIEVEA